MRKMLVFLLILILLLSCCACGKKTHEPTEVNTENIENVTPADVSLPRVSGGDVVIAGQGDSALPVLEDYTLFAEMTANKDDFVFAGEKADTLTCNKIVIIDEDGTTEYAFSFAEDGSGLTMHTLQADGQQYTTLVEFDEQGRLVNVYNGSGSYSNYTYGDGTCVLKAYTADDALQDQRTYFYDENDRTERIERSDEQGVYEVCYYTCDENGQNLSLRVENESGYVLYEYTYDENNMHTATRIEQNGVFYGWQLYTYDANGNRLTESFYNKEDMSAYFLDVHVEYANEYTQDGVYLGTVEKNVGKEKANVSVAYGYITTVYPHYAEFVDTHFMNY